VSADQAPSRAAAAAAAAPLGLSLAPLTDAEVEKVVCLLQAALDGTRAVLAERQGQGQDGGQG
jgi:hypothetical protein